jgi:outer membrane protein OmpA-like peptidoglycan-associated protein
MEGPAGPAGRPGPAGAQGVTGHAGAQGSTTPGVAGPTGLAGARGPQGKTGDIGAQGGVGDVSCWTSYREFWFQNNSSEIPDSEKYKLADIAAYMKANPSLNLGLDGSVGKGGTEAPNQNLSDRRTKAIREGLVAAGVPTHKISVGAYGDTTLQRDRRVEVLFASAN